MGILSINKKELTGQSEEFKGTKYEGQEFKIEIVELPFSSALALSKTNTSIDNEETQNIKNLYIEQLTACVKNHEGLFSDNGKLTREQAEELFEYHQDIANIIISSITDVSFKKK